MFDWCLIILCDRRYLPRYRCNLIHSSEKESVTVLINKTKPEVKTHTDNYQIKFELLQINSACGVFLQRMERWFREYY